MIKIAIKSKKEAIKKITIIGHAEFDEKGRDIVCAAVSSIVITTINAIMRLNENTIKYEEKANQMEIMVKEAEHITIILLINMIELLDELKEEYPDNIEIRRC